VSKLVKNPDIRLITKVAKAICGAEGTYDWKYLKDLDGNPSTAWKYLEYIKMAEAAINAL